MHKLSFLFTSDGGVMGIACMFESMSRGGWNESMCNIAKLGVPESSREFLYNVV